jgi:sugar (pentulose or hexulose) kinase
VDGLSLQQRIAGVPVGAEGLRMLPGIAGERAPFWRPEARGEVRGWRVEHRREHFFRAAMEATAYRAARLVGEMIATGLSLSTVRLAGGGSAMPLWNRIRAGAFGQVGVPETVVCSSGEATLVGSAIFSELALAGGDPEQVSRVWVPEVAPVEPPATEGQASLAAEYDRMFTELEAGA